MQPEGFGEGAAGFAGVANERGDRLAVREQAADDLAADAAGGAITAVTAGIIGSLSPAPPPRRG